MVNKIMLKFLNKLAYAFLYRRNYRIYSFTTFVKLIYNIGSGKLNSFPYPSRNVKKFTNKFLSFNKIRYGICVTNGTDALRVALKAIKTNRNDEIIFSSITYHTTASVAIELGLKPVFVDMNSDDLSLNIDDLKNKISNKTKAIVLVHLGCMVNDISEIQKICKNKKIYLIEDCAHTPSAQFNNKSVGTFGDFGIFSFQQSKLISSGEGGFISIKKKEHYQRCLSLVDCGRNYKDPHKTLGTNLRMSDYQAILLNYKFDKFIKKIKKINNNINYLNTKLDKFDEIKVLKFNKKYNLKSTYYYPFQLSEDFLKKNSKEKFLSKCSELGLNIKGKLYDPVYLNPEFGYLDTDLNIKYRKSSCNTTENIILKKFVWIDFILFTSNKFFILLILLSLKKVLSEVKK